MLPERIAQKIDAEGICWVWTAAVDQKGYGRIWWNGNMRLAHRVVWEILVGPPPQMLDHVCNNTSCVNTDHLRKADAALNAKRSMTGRWKRPDHCKNGHTYDEDNTYLVVHSDIKTTRSCRVCRAAAQRRYLQRKKDKALE